MDPLILPPAVAEQYQRVRAHEVAYTGALRNRSGPDHCAWARERAADLLLLHTVEAVTPLGRVRLALVLGDQVPAVAALARRLGLDGTPIQTAGQTGIAFELPTLLPLVLAWDAPAVFGNSQAYPYLQES